MYVDIDYFNTAGIVYTSKQGCITYLRSLRVCDDVYLPTNLDTTTQHVTTHSPTVASPSPTCQSPTSISPTSISRTCTVIEQQPCINVIMTTTCSPVHVTTTNTAPNVATTDDSVTTTTPLFSDDNDTTNSDGMSTTELKLLVLGLLLLVLVICGICIYKYSKNTISNHIPSLHNMFGITLSNAVTHDTYNSDGDSNDTHATSAF